MTLEGGKPKVEDTETTLKIEEDKSTQEGKIPTVDITKTPEFQKALDEALGKGLSSTNKQLSLHQTETKRAKAEAELFKSQNEELKQRQEELDRENERLAQERFAGDDEALKGYKNSRAQERRNKELDLRQAEIDQKRAELDGLAWAIQMHDVADELTREYQVSRKVLENCTSEQQMRAIAEQFPKVGEKEADKDEKPKKFDSAVSRGGGQGWRELSPDEKIRLGLSNR